MTNSAIQIESATSIRLQLNQILRKQIREGQFAAGAGMPSERDLAGRPGISRASVREAITELIEAGILTGSSRVSNRFAAKPDTACISSHSVRAERIGKTGGPARRPGVIPEVEWRGGGE